MIAVGRKQGLMMKSRNRFKRWVIVPLLAMQAVTSGCISKRDPNLDVIKLGAYSVVREVVHDGLIPAFTEKWKAETGRQVQFEESYNASGAQARSIASGFDADLAILSHEGDMGLLVKEQRVDPGWNAGPAHGIVSNSLVVIGHRPGNPKGIKDWSDLAKPGVGVLYPDPKTSGGARWNINAIYGAASFGDQGSKPEPAAVRDLLAGIQKNVINMDPSGRQSMANFVERKAGDAIVSYENELRLRNKDGEAIPYVIPLATLLIESPAAIVKTSVDAHGNRKVAEAFLAFMFSAEGQRIFSEYGFRPVKTSESGIDSPGTDPLPAKLFTMADLGGWAKIEDELYGPKGLWVSIFTDRSRSGGK
jgi:sulfate transport system substrate-binding protein